METEVRDVVCFCRYGGKKVIDESNSITYIGGVTDAIVIKTNTTYVAFKEILCNQFSIDVHEKVIWYTSKMDKCELLRLSNDLSMRAMFLVNDNTINVYIDGLDSLSTRINFRTLNDDCGRSRSLSNDMISTSFQEFTSNPCQNTYGQIQKLMGEGQLFESPDAFTLFAFTDRFGFKYMNNSQSYYSIKCKVENCPWKVTAGCEGQSDVVRVKKLKNVHLHTVQDVRNFKPVVHSKYLERIVMNKIRETPTYVPRQIGKDLDNEFRVKINYMQSWRTNERAKEAIDGKPEDSYKLIPWMCQRLKESIPDTIAEWTCTEDRKFKQIFVAYGCSIRGFKVGCRPILSIDACHLSGNYKGTLLGATSYDAEDGLYPLAYGIVSGENDEDWLWFLRKLKEVIGERIVTIMTDRHPSLISGVKDVFGSQCHSWCLRHLMENFTRFMKLRGKSKDTAKELLNKIVYARTTKAYEKALKKMAHFRMELRDWGLDNGPEHWANALFPLRRWDIMYTNQAESFNDWIKEEKLYSIMRLMDGHLTKLTEFLYRKKMEIGRWSKPVGPNVEDKLKGKQIASHGFSCMPCGPTECVVYDLKKRGFKVLLGKESFCSCMEWTISGIPCAHVCCAIKTYTLNIYEMVDPNLCF